MLFVETCRQPEITELNVTVLVAKTRTSIGCILRGIKNAHQNIVRLDISTSRMKVRTKSAVNKPHTCV